MVVGRSETVARRLAFGLLLLASGIFAAATGLGFAYFLPKAVPAPATLGRPTMPSPTAKLDSHDENLLHLEIGAALLAGAIQSGQTDVRTLGEGLEALRVTLNDAEPALSRNLSSRLHAGLDAVRADMDAHQPAAAASKAEMLHLLLKTQRIMQADRN